MTAAHAEDALNCLFFFYFIFFLFIKEKKKEGKKKKEHKTCNSGRPSIMCAYGDCTEQ